MHRGAADEVVLNASARSPASSASGAAMSGWCWLVVRSCGGAFVVRCVRGACDGLGKVRLVLAPNLSASVAAA